MSDRFSPGPRDMETLRALDAIVGGVVSRADLARHLGMSTALLAIGRRVTAGSRREAARLLGELAHAMGLSGRWAEETSEPASGSVLEELLDTVGHAGRLTSLVHQALADRSLDSVESAEILRQISALEVELHELRAAVSREAR